MGLFDSLGKVAGQLAKTAAETLASPENLGLLSTVASQQLLPEIQAAVLAVSPVAIDVKETLAEQAIVIREEALNEAIARHIESEGIDVVSATVALLENNHLELAVRPRALGIALPAISVPLRLSALVFNQTEGFVMFEVVGPAAVAAHGWFQQLLAALVRALLVLVVRPDWVKNIAPAQVRVEGNQVRVELKDGALSPLYATTVSAALGRPVPLLGELCLADVVQVDEAHIEKGRLIVGFGLDLRPLKPGQPA